MAIRQTWIHKARSKTRKSRRGTRTDEPQTNNKKEKDKAFRCATSQRCVRWLRAAVNHRDLSDLRGENRIFVPLVGFHERTTRAGSNEVTRAEEQPPTSHKSQKTPTETTHQTTIPQWTQSRGVSALAHVSAELHGRTPWVQSATLKSMFLGPDCHKGARADVDVQSCWTNDIMDSNRHLARSPNSDALADGYAPGLPLWPGSSSPSMWPPPVGRVQSTYWPRAIPPCRISSYLAEAQRCHLSFSLRSSVYVTRRYHHGHVLIDEFIMTLTTAESLGHINSRVPQVHSVRGKRLFEDTTVVYST